MLPQIPGLERSFELLGASSPVLVALALLVELMSELCYAELLRRSAKLAYRGKIRSGEKMGIWFAFRLTVAGYGMAHVLPGGGAAAATVTYGALRSRGLDPAKIGLALAAISTLVYGSLGLIFIGSLAYLTAVGDLGPAAIAATLVGLALALVALAGSYAAYRNPGLVLRILAFAGRPIRGLRFGKRAEEWAGELARSSREGWRAVRGQLAEEPLEVARLGGLAFGYWVFDALCFVVVFAALGVPAEGIELVVAYGVATVAGSLPLTPGGIGVFETTALATLALFGVGSEAAVAVLGYRLFNFWLPIPLAAIFYPTLRPGRHVA